MFNPSGSALTRLVDNLALRSMVNTLFKRVPQTTRLLLCGLGALCLVTGLTVFLSACLLRQSAELEVMDRVDANLKVAWRFLHQLGPTIRVVNGQLYAGSVLLNGDTKFVDDVQAVVGGVASIFQGDIRVATNVLDVDGTRGTGTSLTNAAVREAVLAHHRPFRGVVDVLGRRYYSGYDPINDSDGRPIGILYVGIEESLVLLAINRTRDIILGVSCGSILLVGLVLSWLGGKLAAQIALRQTLLETAHAHLETALGNMANGLSLWNASAQLVLVNSRLTAILGLSADSIPPGTTFRAFIEARHRVGNFGHTSLEEAYQQRLRAKSLGQHTSYLDHDATGRTIRVQVHPVEGGGWIATYEDITERHRAEAQVTFMARHDSLTGLANRTQFLDRLRSLLEEKTPFVLLSLDLDRFKQVNDKLGHPVGDGLLQAVAGRLQAAIRDRDLVARLGGDEFAVIQVGVRSTAGATFLASQIIETLNTPFGIEGHEVAIGVSVGISCVSSEIETSDIELLLKQADVALYMAKTAGGGTLRCFDLSMEAVLQQRQMLESDLSRALANAEFEVYYQPLVNVASGAISCFEALLRWHHPKRGTVSPAEFIPVAEQMGLIGALGAWVLRQACLDAMTWPGHIKVAVNLSAIQFQAGDLPTTVREVLLHSGLPARRLELEITESVLLQDVHGVQQVLHTLRDIGVRIAMDDFGTGYSSLSYLRNFPFDKIKIDQSFVRNTGGHAGSSAIVRAIVALADSLGIKTVAEGVETLDQYELVSAEGCGEAQGFLFSRPVPASDISSMLGGMTMQPRLEALGLTQHRTAVA